MRDLGPPGTSSGGQGSCDLDLMRGRKGPVKACVQRDREGSTHIYSYSYSTVDVCQPSNMSMVQNSINFNSESFFVGDIPKAKHGDFSEDPKFKVWYN
jgi:hypothetical protein